MWYTLDFVKQNMLNINYTIFIITFCVIHSFTQLSLNQLTLIFLGLDLHTMLYSIL